jgi:signal peptidase I
MADTLRGAHREVVCVDCGHRFACAAEGRTVCTYAVCPNCGFAKNDLKNRPVIDGDRLLVAKSVFRWRSPRRWELVAFRYPQRSREVCVKRVVGLPGESVQIRDGDVYVDGEIQRKTIDRQRATAILVHDASRPPTGKPTPRDRWQSDGSPSGWAYAGGRYVYSPRSDTTIDWLEYRHWCRTPGEPGQTIAAPIANDQVYDQNRAQRAEYARPVHDVMLSFHLETAPGEGRFAVRIHDGWEAFQAFIDPHRGRYEVSRGAKAETILAKDALPYWGEQHHVEVSVFDRQFLLALDGRPLARIPYIRGSLQVPGGIPVLAIGSAGLSAEIEDLRVYRDIFYTHPIGLMGRWGLDEPVRLGRGEYCVLGDNSSISDDSRTWLPGPAVPESLIVGKPFLVHFPARGLHLGPWHIQVPDPARIRYIR